MATGWTKQAARPDKIYYYNPDGTMSYGEKKIDGHWYYFHERSGVMQTGWVNRRYQRITLQSGWYHVLW